MNFIYITTNLINGKQYIGSHRGEEKDNYLGSGKILKDAILKYGKKKFKRKILEKCEPSLNLFLEEKYIKEYNTLQPDGYNITKNGGFNIFDDDLRDKLRKAKIGRKQSEETKKKRSKSMLGKNTGPKTKETKEKIAKTKKENPYIFTEEQKQKMRDAKIGFIPWNKDKNLSEETKEKMSKFQRQRTKSEEERKNISLSKLGDKNPMYGKTPWNKGLKIKNS